MLCVARIGKTFSFASASSVALSVLLLSACGTTSEEFRIHSPERDKQGQAVKEAWSKVDLKSQLDVPRKNLAKTLSEQLATEEEIWSKRRSVIAGQMASDWTVKKFQDNAAAGLRRVLGTVAPPDTAASAVERYREQAKAVKTQSDNTDRTTAKIVMLGVSAPTCSIATSADKGLKEYADAKLKGFEDANKAGFFVGYLASLKTSCEARQAAKLNLEQIVQPPGGAALNGELGTALLDLKKEEAALEEDKTAAELLAASLKAAQSEYDVAEADFNRSSSAENKKRVDDAIGKLKGWQTKAKELETTPVIGKLLSQVRLESLDKFLATYDAAASGKGTDAGSNRLAVALALLPEMATKSAEALAKADRPNLTPFVLRKNIEQAKVDAASRDVERRGAIIDLRRKIVATLEDQLDAYDGAYGASLQVATKAKIKTEGKREDVEVDARWADALQAVDAKPNATVPKAVLDPKIAAWRASMRYLEAEGRMRSDVGQNYYRIYALQYETVLSYAESSIEQWKGLVDPSVDLLSQWGASGVVPQDVIQLFNSIMLLGIAVGVN